MMISKYVVNLAAKGPPGSSAKVACKKPKYPGVHICTFSDNESQVWISEHRADVIYILEFPVLVLLSIKELTFYIVNRQMISILIGGLVSESIQ